MEPFNEIVDQALSNLRSDVTNPDSFSQQETEEIQAELAAVINDILEHESFLDGAVLLDDTSLNMLFYTALVLISAKLIPKLDHLIKSSVVFLLKFTLLFKKFTKFTGK